MNARFYDPVMGRFVSADPIGQAGRDQNLYRYAGNAPTYATDPRGYESGFAGLTVCNETDSGRRYTVTILPPEDDPAYTCISIHEATHELQCQENGPDVDGSECNRDEQQAMYLELWCRRQEGLPTEEAEELLRKANLGVYPGCEPGPPPPPLPPLPPLPPQPDSGAAGDTEPAGSFDPNAKIGPQGFGEGHYVEPAALLSYSVHFENLSNASAPAQQVTVHDQLSEQFDRTSFELTEIAFGDVFIVVPPHSPYYRTRLPLQRDGVSFELEIEAGLRMATGEVYARFWSLLPGTGLPPAIGTGFLPPEDGTGRGQGHISYAIRAKPDLATGTELRNVASIVFDGNPAITTNQRDPLDPSKGSDPEKEARITIDADVPSSAVDPLPAEMPSGSWVRWRGWDKGAGVAAYDIYVAESGGPWSLWLANTTDTAARFHGQTGRAYLFYSVARDHLGRVEPPPGAPDAETTIGRALPILEAAFSNGVLDLRFTTERDRFYRLEERDDLLQGSWEPVPEHARIVGTGDTVRITTQANVEPRRFYRIVLFE
jgi:hypothetical protein